MSENQIEILLDGRRLLLDSDLSFSDLSHELKNELGSERVVTEIFVDEKPINIEEESGLQNQQLKNMGKLRFESKEIGHLLKDSLQLAPMICDALQLDCYDIDHLFEASNFAEANERIAEFSSLVDWLLQMVSSLQSYGNADFRQMKAGDFSVVDLISRTDAHLKALHQKLQFQEYVAFRKILIQDFHPELSYWKQIFEQAVLEWQPKDSRPQ